jgi:superfamily II RNA helicase
LPALCFVLSRKQLEKCANEITTNLQEFDTKVPYTVDRECEQILRSKLPNFQEYLNLPEYVNMLNLVRKGIAIHHSGVLPVIKEIVELLYAKGYIKLLFATETFSIGVNMPTKTVIFTDVNKFDGNVNRMLYSHEMSQMSGRAGRRGIDTVGHVIHLNNLFRNVDSVSYKNMMNGKPQKLSSKFKISYNLLLNLLDIGDNNLVNFASRSMVTGDLDKEMKILNQKMIELDAELDIIKERSIYLRTPIEVIEEFINLEKDRPHSVNKKRKDIEKRIREIHENCKFIENDRNSYQKRFLKESEINDCQNQLDKLQSYIHSCVHTVLQLLQEEGFVNSDISLDNNDLSTTIKLSLKGKIATQMREVHCLVFARIVDDKLIDHLSSKELASLFSIFTNIKVQDDMKDFVPQIDNVNIKKCIDHVTTMYTEYSTKESSLNINTGFDYNIHYDLLYYLDKWCECSDVESCKLVLQEMGKEKQIFLGEFVKALLKINNISSEMEKIAEMTGNIAFLSKLKEIPNMTLKYVVTNQSLYV